jgi:hypothetical protein
MFELICMSYALQFSLPLYLNPNQITILSVPTRLPWQSILNALTLTTLGISVMIASYYIWRFSPPARRIQPLNLSLDYKQSRRYLIFAITTGLLIYFSQSIGVVNFQGSRIGAIALLAANQFNLALIILAYQVYTKGQQPVFPPFILYGLGVVAFALGLSTGMLESTFIPVFFVLVVYWHTTKKIPWRLMFVGVIIFGLLNDVKHDYRSQVWFSNTSLTERVMVWFDLTTQRIGELIQGDGRIEGEAVFRKSAERFNLLHRFAHVLEMTPDIVPYHDGASYQYFLYTWVPRVIWSDKPNVASIINSMDRSYLLVGENARAGIGIGHLPEAYANFGVIGVTIVMSLQGFFFALFGRLYSDSESAAGRAIYLLIMVVFMNGIGTYLAVHFGNILQQIIVYTLVIQFFAGRLQPKSKTMLVSPLVINKR